MYDLREYRLDSGKEFLDAHIGGRGETVLGTRNFTLQLCPWTNQTSQHPDGLVLRYLRLPIAVRWTPVSRFRDPTPTPTPTLLSLAQIEML